MDILYSAVAFVVALGLLVTVHEFGHFWVARRLGIKVLKFSVGFGRALWSRRYGADGTEYVIAMIPLGGYVKMLDGSEGTVAAHERHRAFDRQPLMSRTAVVVAGPAFNFLFAVLAYWCMYMIGVDGLRPVVTEIVPGTVAGQGGFRDGDTIESVGGGEVATWQSATQAIIAASLDEERIGIGVVDAGGQRRERTIDLAEVAVDDLTRGRFFERIGFAPAQPQLPATIGWVEPGGPAERDGLRAGDRVVRADGEAVADWPGWVRLVRSRPGETFTVTVERDGAGYEIALTPDAERAGDGSRFGRIGAAVHEPDGFVERYYATERHGPGAAFVKGVVKTGEISVLTLRMMWKMLMLEVSLDNLSGPVGIAQYAGASAQFGLARFLEFLGIVSVSLGILNLLPIPLLDGGHLLYYAVESVRGRPLSEESRFLAQRFGILVLFGLMGLALYNDFARLLG